MSDRLELLILTRLTEIHAYHNNQLKACWNGFSVPSVGDHLHTSQHEYIIMSVHWVDGREPNLTRAVNLDLQRIEGETE